ncbi:MAG: PD40 domain-containing protein [Anaerolineae bacterium]|nr:PD40 domain-containing protein [Anaerolineae bacterium]
MSKLENILDNCLNQLITGQSTLEECLARYPEYAPELRRLLMAAQTLEQGQSAEPTPIFKAKARAQLVAHMKAGSKNRRRSAGWRFFWPPLFGRTLNMAFGVAAVLILFLSTGTVLAQSALPGDALYDWKLASEQVLRTVHPNPLTVDLMVAERRINDLAQVTGNDEAVAVALNDYQQTLSNLSHYDTPESREIISLALNQQKAELDHVQLDVPELDKLLTEFNPTAEDAVASKPVEVQFDYQGVNDGGRIFTYQTTITNTTSSEPISATFVSALSSNEEYVSVSEGNCILNEKNELACDVDDLALNAARTITVTTRAVSCYAGSVTNTATLVVDDKAIEVNPNDHINVTNQVDTLFPYPARVVYVQSGSQTSDLGLVTSTASSLNAELHRWAAAPAWSPDGKRLAFFGVQGISQLEEPYNQGNGVWIVDIINNTQQNPRQLLAMDHVKNLTWSPDGSKIALEVGPPGITHEVVVIDAQDGRQLYRFSGEQPAWSPDSQQLVIKSCSDACGLWLVKLDGTIIRQLTTDSSDSYPTWSPTGEYMAFSSRDRDQDWEIYLLHLEDGQITRLTQRAGTDTTPVFGPCGQELYLRTDHYGSWWITALPLSGRDEYKVQEGVGSTEDWGLARPAVY